MITKAQIKNALEYLPENFTIDQVIDQLLFIEKAQRGLKESAEGKINTKAQAKVKLKIG
jgi:hypothetical protein